MKTSNEKKLWLKVLVDSGYTHTRINKQLVKEEQIKMKLMNRLFKVFNTDKTNNKEVTRFVPLELDINKHMENINTAVTDLNSINMLLKYDWLVKHNSEISQDKETI